MKNNFKAALLVLSALLIIQIGCKKDNLLKQQETVSSQSGMRGDMTKTYNTDVAKQWMKLELKIMRTTTGFSNLDMVRPMSYSGVAFYESVVPGMPSYKSLVGQLTDLPAMPTVNVNLNYHWACSANASMAKVLKLLYPTMNAANLASVDSLESAFNTQYSANTDAATIARSIAFGQGVAQTVYNWSLTDGSAHLNDPYTVPTGPGLWVPTPPAFAATPAGPYWGNLRPMVSGSLTNTQPPAPPAYSETPGSDFYDMVNHVYTTSQTLTQAQIDQAFYYRDVPGLTTPGHYLSVLEQVVEQQNPSLEVIASAFALSAITVYDASIGTWQTKYTYNLVRPITYIRSVLGHPTWNSLLGTPGHPEYSSAHASLSSSFASAMAYTFGDNVSFTDHSYDYLGFPARSFNSFTAFGVDAGNSRLFAGIHYQLSIDRSLVQGTAVAQNIQSTLVLKKP